MCVSVIFPWLSVTAVSVALLPLARRPSRSSSGRPGRLSACRVPSREHRRRRDTSFPGNSGVFRAVDPIRSFRRRRSRPSRRPSASNPYWSGRRRPPHRCDRRRTPPSTGAAIRAGSARGVGCRRRRIAGTASARRSSVGPPVVRSWPATRRSRRRPAAASQHQKKDNQDRPVEPVAVAPRMAWPPPARSWWSGFRRGRAQPAAAAAAGARRTGCRAGRPRPRAGPPAACGAGPSSPPARNRVVPSGMPPVTSRGPPRGEPAPPKHAVPKDRRPRVFRAARRKPARRRDHGPNHELIRSNQPRTPSSHEPRRVRRRRCRGLV
jgi:hypothetical protein